MSAKSESAVDSSQQLVEIGEILIKFNISIKSRDKIFLFKFINFLEF